MKTVIIRKIKPIAQGDFIAHVVAWMEERKEIQLPKIKRKAIKHNVVKHTADESAIGMNAIIQMTY